MLTPEQKAAMKAAVAAFGEPIDFGRSRSEFMFAAGIAHERARADKLQSALEKRCNTEPGGSRRCKSLEIKPNES